MPPCTPENKFPSDILNLLNWKITLPSGKKGSPEEIKQPDLLKFSNPFFYVNTVNNSVVFIAECGGFTTSGSKYPRSELREMNSKELASWDIAKGSHLMSWTAAITHIPFVKQQVVVGQIHNDKDDLMFIRLSKNILEVVHNSVIYGILDENYKLGSKYTMSILAKEGEITVTYNNTKKIIIKPKNSKANYFKLGMYTQSNVSKGDKAKTYGKVEIYDCLVIHE